jgi:hypothetical protein
LLRILGSRLSLLAALTNDWADAQLLLPSNRQSRDQGQKRPLHRGR